MRLAIFLAACASAAPPAPHQPPSPPPQPADPDLVDVDLQPPVPELARDASHPLALPPPPAFELPPPSADGSHSARELRVAGVRRLDSALTVKGVVTWVYDCAAALRKPGESDKAVRARIDADPTLCERPKFYLGDSATTPLEKSIWVVDLPRPYNKLEVERIKKADRTSPDRCEPADKDKPTSVCVPYRVGDEVLVTGTWALASPHAERNSDGLLVYQRMKNLTLKRESPGGVPVVASPALAAPATTPVAPADIAKRPLARVHSAVRAESLAAADEGVRAYAQRQLEAAIAALTRATDRWRDNHRAWYALAAAYAQRGEWAKAADAAHIAVELVPDAAMYHLLYAVALNQKLLQDNPTDPSAINFERVQSHAAAAIALEPALWRAHMLLGVTYRHAGRARDAAAELTKALALGPAEAAPWIALAELYREWDYTDQAIVLCTLAATTVQPPLGDVWFELGLAYDDKRSDDKAIDAYTHALDGGVTKALFSRGQVYLRTKKYSDARRDLEQYLQLPSIPEFFRSQASRMLLDIGRR
jgi:tetratricopeptide (TPR) repeat protein